MACRDDYGFVDLVPARLVCSICSNVMKDPHLVVCCGSKYCCTCLQNWLDAKPLQICPHCRATENSAIPFQHVVDRAVHAEIESLKIMCSNANRGCGWMGKMRDLAAHLELDSGCEYSLLDCPNKCHSGVNGGGTKVLRKDMSDHLTYHCEPRTIICGCCSHEGTAKDDGSHQLSCKLLPAECPNCCREQGLVRETVEGHWQIGKLEWTSCEYADVGCVAKIKLQDKFQHMVDFQTKHLEMMTSAFRNLESEVQQRRKVANHELKLLTKAVGDHHRSNQTDFWLASLLTQFSSPLKIAEISLVLRMLNLSEVRSCKMEWKSPELLLDAFTIYFIVKGVDYTNLHVKILLKTSNLARESMAGIRARIYFHTEQLPNSLPESKSVGGRNKDRPSWHVADAFYDFQSSSLPDLAGSSSDHVLKKWRIEGLCGEGFEDSLVWTVYRSKLEVA